MMPQLSGQLAEFSNCHNRTMLTDLVQIRHLGEKKRDENLRFRKHLKSHVFVERRFRKIAQDIEAEIDCTLCANCCRVATTKLVERDIDKMARYLGLSREAFLNSYTAVNDEEGLVLKRTAEGCVFLSGNE